VKVEILESARKDLQEASMDQVRAELNISKLEIIAAQTASTAIYSIKTTGYS